MICSKNFNSKPSSKLNVLKNKMFKSIDDKLSITKYTPTEKKKNSISIYTINTSKILHTFVIHMIPYINNACFGLYALIKCC